jgi:hypothetical protein
MSDTAEATPANCAVRALRFVALDLLNPRTPFLQFLRKLVVLTSFVPAILALFTLATFFIPGLAGGSEPTAAFLVALVASFIVMATGTVSYVAAHRAGEVADWALCVALYGTFGGGLLVSITFPNFPGCLWTVVYAIFAALSELPGRNVFLCMLVTFFGICAYNTCALMTDRRAPLAVPGSESVTFDVAFQQYVFAFIGVALPVIACILQTAQHRKLLAAADDANQLSRDAAELLRNYDTAGVSALLAEYRELPDADPALIESYTALVDNLNQYRPHLPNWMVDTQADDDSRADDAETQRSDRSTRSRDSRKSHTSMSGTSGVSHEAPGSADVLNVARVPKTVASIAFGIVDFKVAGELSAAARGVAVSAFSDVVHRLAAVTHCAVHSFVGDTVQLSWNATLRAVQPEVKAARFLCALKAALAGNGDVSVAAAAMHGKATTQFAGTGAVQAVAISLPWRTELRTLMAFASRHRAFVVHHKMAAVASHACVTRAVEALQVPDATASETVVVHEVLAERGADDDNDEWMYVLDKDATDKVTAALNACVCGEYGAAMSLLEAVADTASTVESLKKRTEAALGNPPPTFAVGLCCVV